MGLMDRVSTLLRANLNDLIDKAEDPSKMIKQVILDMENQLLQVKTQVAISIADQHMLEKKGMYPNVDFYSASTYYLMGIPLDLFTPIFAVSRISGWTGHILEQYAHNKLIRPRAEYIGQRGLKYVPIAER